MKILVIDDDAMILKLMASKLSQNGYEVTTASQADEALKQMNTNRPDLIIADVMMPYMSGLEFLNVVNYEYMAGIKVMLMSSLINHEVISLSMNLGAVDYIQKPINFHQLIPKINRLAN